jgi:hypothetical protein
LHYEEASDNPELFYFPSGFLLLIITVFILFYFVVKYPENFSLFFLINTAVITPYIYLVTITGIGQPTLWQIQPGKSKEKLEEEITQAELMESSKKEETKDQPLVKGLPESKVTEIISRILQLMEKDKLYQEPELTLQALSINWGFNLTRHRRRLTTD